MENQGDENQSQQGANEANFNLFRSMRDHMHPPRMNSPSCIVLPQDQMVIRPYLVPLLPQFHGMENENKMKRKKMKMEKDKENVTKPMMWITRVKSSQKIKLHNIKAPKRSPATAPILTR